MYRTMIAKVMGKLCMDEGGRTLERIGNMNVNAGDAVWTDGRVIYGNEYAGADSLLLSGGREGGIPVVFGKYFYILSYADGSIRRSYTFSGDEEIVGFVNDGKRAFVELSSENGKVISWYDVMTGGLVYRTDERAADAQIAEDGTLLSLELGDITYYGTKSRIGLFKAGTLAVRLPTTREVARNGLTMLQAEAGNRNGSATIYGHSGRITKGGNFYTTLANFSGHVGYEGPVIQLSSNASVRVVATMNAQGRAYTENGVLTWAQFWSNIQNPEVKAVAYGNVSEAEKYDEPVADRVIPILQGVGAVTQWVDPNLGRSAPILILITGGDGFTTAFPFPKEMYESEEQYWDSWERCILMPGGAQFIKVKGEELLSGHLKPRGAYFYYTNTTVYDTYTYREHFPLNDDFATTKEGSAWVVTDGGTPIYRVGSSLRQCSLYKLKDGGYLLQNGNMAAKIDWKAQSTGFICGSRNYRFCHMPEAEKVYRQLAELLSSQ